MKQIIPQSEFEMAKILLLCLFLIGFAAAFRTGRIYGGQPAVLGQFPHQVSLAVDGMHFCGGSILSRSIIITAAHCTLEMPHDKLTVRAGSLSSKDGGQVVRVKKIVEHPEWDPMGTIHNDISIILLETPLDIDNKITKAIELAEKETPGGLDAVVSGWGMQPNQESASVELMFVVLETLNSGSCEKLYDNYVRSMICAGYPDSNIGVTRMDSGGPLVVDGKLVGIVSFREDRKPSVFTQVSAYISWIEEVIKNM